MWQYWIVFGSVLIVGGVIQLRREKSNKGYVRLYTNEELKKYRSFSPKESVKEESPQKFSGFFENKEEVQNDKLERKIRKLREKKEKKWHPMGLFGN